jgi:hypothetical protein
MQAQSGIDTEARNSIHADYPTNPPLPDFFVSPLHPHTHPLNQNIFLRNQIRLIHAQSPAVRAPLLGIAIVPRIINAHLIFGARERSEAAA